MAVDSIGPWKITINGIQHEFSALSIIDTVSNLVELARLDNRTAFEAARRMEQAWLYRYSRPVQCIYDPGTEFMAEFGELLDNWSIKKKPTGVRSPEANAVEATALIDHFFHCFSCTQIYSAQNTTNNSWSCSIQQRYALGYPLHCQLDSTQRKKTTKD